MAGEVEAGASIRQAVVAAADRAAVLDLARVVRLAAAGRPAGEVSAALEQALPLNGRLAGAAYHLVVETGARASAVFAGLAVRAADVGELSSRASGALGPGPVVGLAGRWPSGRPRLRPWSSGGDRTWREQEGR